MVACVRIDNVEFLRSSQLTARCARSDVDPEWWIDQDSTVVAKSPERTRTQLRAQLLCYECPFVLACREQAWDEPAHVWGGLTLSQRYNARREGQIRDLGIDKTFKPISAEALQSFLKGDRTEAVAATMHHSARALVVKLRNELHRRRLLVEEKQWGSKPHTPPALPKGVTLMTQFMAGVCLSERYQLGPESFESSPQELAS